MKKFGFVAAALLATAAMPAAAAPIFYTLTGQFSGTLNGDAFANQAATVVGVGDTDLRFTAQDANFVPLSSLTITSGGTSYTVAPTVNFWSSQSVGSSGFKYFPSPDIYAFNGLGAYDNKSSLAATPVSGYFFGNFATISGDQFSLTASSGTQFSAQIAAVPEPATWAMMLIGFGMVGAGVRSRRKPTVKVTYA